MAVTHSHLQERSSLYKSEVPQSVQQFLPPEIAELVDDSLRLWQFHHEHSSQLELNDYSFIIFPLAKAYEGYLKIFFFQTGILQKDVYHARNFRIGRSFNPDLVPRLRDELWLYDDVARMCGEDVARELWQIWLDARNHLFHFFPGDRYVLTLKDANNLLHRVLDAMALALAAPVKV